MEYSITVLTRLLLRYFTLQCHVRMSNSSKHAGIYRIISGPDTGFAHYVHVNFVNLTVVFHFSPMCSDFLDVQVYLTRGWREEQAAAIRIREEDETDAITGFQAKTNYGRPDWPKIFDSMSLAHPK